VGFRARLAAVRAAEGRRPRAPDRAQMADIRRKNRPGLGFGLAFGRFHVFSLAARFFRSMRAEPPEDVKMFVCPSSQRTW
jgi:hypothetical protein